ncbi:uncharacterized protein THITE_13177, partial [Thermothielavioides terrestris NRRL 8126]
ELLGHCILGFLPLLIASWTKPYALVLGACGFLSHYLMQTFTAWQLFWIYTAIGIAHWVGKSYSGYAQITAELRVPATESSFGRWLTVTVLTALADIDVMAPPRVSRGEFSHRGCIYGLRRRRGTRPKIPKLVPMAQLNQKASPATCHQIGCLLESYQARHPNHLQLSISFLDPGLDGVRRSTGIRAAGATHQRENGEWGGEIAQVHHANGLVHVVLHPEDISTVVEAGWGQRHPLCANDKRWFRFLFQGIWERPLPVPEGLTLIYAPRDALELQALDVILRAAIWYATAGELYPSPVEEE